MTDMLNGKGQNVCRLPPPVSCPVGSAGEPVNLRIPPVEKPAESKVGYVHGVPYRKRLSFYEDLHSNNPFDRNC